jgi:TusA-related sulfurtransferase
MNVRIDKTLDVRGESCPYPELYTLETLAAMRSGEVLEVIADCVQAFVNVPAAVARYGHHLLAEPRKDGPEFSLYVEARHSTHAR